MWPIHSKIMIRKSERGLVFQRGDFVGVLAPGLHKRSRLAAWRKRERIEVTEILDPAVRHRLLPVLAREASFAEQAEVLTLSQDQRALVWRDGVLGWILEPGVHAFWKGLGELEIEVLDATAFVFEHARLEAILEHPEAYKVFGSAVATPKHRTLIVRDGQIAFSFETGRKAWFEGVGNVRSVSFDLRERVADVAGQEILTRDKVTLRVNLTVTWKLTSAEQAFETVTDPEQALYREAQLALRAAVGTRTLDQLLTDKEAVGRDLAKQLAGRATGFGVQVVSVGLKDIVLPGEMKTLLNQVIEAQKQSEANLIRRREETAAARSQANTAKLLAASPVLTRMKELEALKEILTGTKATFVLGSGDLLGQVRGLSGATEAETPEA